MGYLPKIRPIGAFSYDLIHFLLKIKECMSENRVSHKIATCIRGGGKIGRWAKWDAHEQIQISQEPLNIWQYNFFSD